MKIWVGIVPGYGKLTSYDPPDAQLAPFMVEQDVVDVMEMEGNPYYEQFIADGLRAPSFAEEMAAFKNERRLPIREAANDMVRRSMARTDLTKLYSWAVPTPQVVEYIRGFLEHGIYEIGAGSGYWARVITQCRKHDRYYAFDNYTSHGFTHRYYEVETDPIDDECWARCKVLFLCWPSYGDPFAYEAVRDLKPEHVFYVGESDGCTADEKFRNIMEELYEEVEDTPDVEQHQHIHDHFYHYKVGGS